MTEKWQVKRISDGKFYSIDNRTGNAKWSDSPDMGYLYSSKEEAEKVKKFVGEDSYVVEYDKDWWKKYNKGGSINNEERSIENYKNQLLSKGVQRGHINIDDYSNPVINEIATSIAEDIQEYAKDSEDLGSSDFASFYRMFILQAKGFDILDAKFKNRVEYANGGNISFTIPKVPFFAKVKPYGNAKEIIVKIVPDTYNNFIAGYSIYHPYNSVKKSGYIKKNQLLEFLKNKEYTIVSEPISGNEFAKGGMVNKIDEILDIPLDRWNEKQISNIHKIAQRLKAIDFIEYYSGGGFKHIILLLPNKTVIELTNDNGIVASKKKYSDLENEYLLDDDDTKTGYYPSVEIENDFQNVSEIVSAINDSDNWIYAYAKGGEVNKNKQVDNLVKELKRLQRELNSPRLRTYMEGDTSEEQMARFKEREIKLARFNEVLELLRSQNAKYAKGGEVEGYIDLSKKSAQVVNDSHPNKLPVIDIVKKSEIKFSKEPIRSSEEVVDLMREVYGDTLNTFESVYVVMLNKRNLPIYIYDHSKGGIDGTVMDSNLILATANKVLAKGIILVHNHPSGNLTPSSADDKMTEKIKNAAALLDISLLDHIILTKDAFYSYAEQGKMAKGGVVKKPMRRTTFKEKVEAIKSKLLKNKKVPKAVQKDYGKTFSPSEAEDSAKRIAGAMRKKELAGKYESGGSTDLSSGKNFNAIGISKTKSARFGTHSYLLSVNYDNPRLVKGKKLIYGYLERYTGKTGTSRGWFVQDVSMDVEDFNKFWDLMDIFVVNAKNNTIKPL